MSETVTMTLTEFLLARIAEDEAASKFPSAETAAKSAHRLADEAYSVRLTHPPKPGWAAALEDGARVLKRFSPDRVLAECEAKRRIVAWHGPDHVCEDGMVFSESTPKWDEGDDDREPCDMLKIIALPYADHPDYREEWRP